MCAWVIAAVMTSTTGKYGMGNRCANGGRLLYYAAEHELFITNACFLLIKNIKSRGNLRITKTSTRLILISCPLEKFQY